MIYLKNTFNLSKTEILENVYMKPHANVYIASFMKFISNHRDDTYFKDMIFEGMKHFMSIHVCCYKNFKDVKTHFIGSIGHYFREELTAAAEVLGVNVGSVVKKPINGLVHYHLNYHSRKIGA